MLIDDALYLIETWDSAYTVLPLSDRQLVHVATYFLRNIDPDHTMSGEEFMQIQGECAWYRVHGSLTILQARWLLHTLRENIHHINHYQL